MAGRIGDREGIRIERGREVRELRPKVRIMMAEGAGVLKKKIGSSWPKVLGGK